MQWQMQLTPSSWEEGEGEEDLFTN